jgi:tetratricopeptide (TPR) repeat protein
VDPLPQRATIAGVTRALPTLLLAAALSAAIATALMTRHHGQAHYLATQRYEDVYYLPPPDWMVLFSLGHREAMAGLVWLRALIYFGEELQHRGQVDNLYNYTDAMLALDPHFKRVYQWVASTSLYRTGDIEADDARRAIRYLEQGVRMYPDDGELAWTLGATYLYELPALLPMEERAEPRRRGLEHLQVAARLGAGPPWLVLSTATELGRLGQREQEIAHLQEVYDQISDRSVKEQIELRLSGLRDAAFSEALRQTYEEIEAARATHFPYLDRELFLLVGPRPPFDGRALLLRGFDPEPDHFQD